jgi:hypothetical protein
VCGGGERAIVKVVRSEIKQTSAIINLLVAVGCESDIVKSSFAVICALVAF